MIRQQIYTRGRRGYATIAKSPTLSDAFLKEKIHPYCFFGGNTRALTLAHLSCGNFIFGQAVHVPKDFTGQRTAFFVHNLIFSADEAGNYFENIENFLRADFKISHDEEEIFLSEISRDEKIFSSEISHDEKKFLNKFLHEEKNFSNEIFSNEISREEKFFSFEFGEKIIDEIAQRVLESVIKSKKTYVIIPREIENKHEFACAALTKIYRKIPRDAKHLLGFCTNTREPEKRKNIHLIFCEDEIRGIDSSHFCVDLRARDVNFDEISSKTNQHHENKITREKNFVQENSAQENFSQENFAQKISTQKNLSQENFSQKISAQKNSVQENFLQKTPSQNFFDERISALSAANFFSETEFWYARGFSSHASAEISWLEKNFDTLSPQQFSKIPDEFIRRGKNGDSPQIYIMLSILKKFCAALFQKKIIPTRYLIGNYFFSHSNHEKILKNLLRVQNILK